MRVNLVAAPFMSGHHGRALERCLVVSVRGLVGVRYLEVNDGVAVGFVTNGLHQLMALFSEPCADVVGCCDLPAAILEHQFILTQGARVAMRDTNSPMNRVRVRVCHEFESRTVAECGQKFRAALSGIAFVVDANFMSDFHRFTLFRLPRRKKRYWY